MKVSWNYGRRPLAAALVAMLVALGASTTAGASESAAHAAKATTLVVWDPGASYGLNQKQRNAFYAMVAEVNKRFEKANPGVKVKDTHLSYSDFATKVPAAVASHSAPDVLFYGPDDTLLKYTQPLDGMLSAAQRKQITFLKQSVSAKDNKIHTLPFGTYEGVWMYNKALFRQNGIKVPTTQAQFLQACDTLDKAGIVPIRNTFGGQYTMDRYVALLAGQLIPNFVAWNAQKIPFTTAGYKAGVQAFLDMTTHKCWGPNPESKGVSGEGDQMFRAGKTAIQYVLVGPDVADYEKSIGKGNLGVFLQPALPGGKPSMDAAPNYGFDIVKTSKHQDLAWKYLSFWTSPAQEKLGWDKIGQLPNVTNVKITSRVPVYKQMLAWAADPQFHVGAWPVNAQEFKVWDDLTPEVITGRTSVDDLLSKLQDARNATKG